MHVHNNCDSQNPSEFAQTVEEVLISRKELTRLKAGCTVASSRYSLETMVENFAGGVIAALETPVR